MLRTSVSPHLHSRIGDIPHIMWNVNIGLVPVMAASIYFFGMRALFLIIICVLTAIISELLIQLILRRKITIHDGSAVITGILVALNMPPAIPF